VMKMIPNQATESSISISSFIILPDPAIHIFHGGLHCERG
jgi:hypothetical protein